MKKLFLIILCCFSNIALATPIDLSRAVGQMMLVGFDGTEINESSPIVKEIRDFHIGGVILDNHKQGNTGKRIVNIVNPEQLKKLTDQLQYYAKKYDDYPLFIAVNQEGGLINALKPSMGFDNEGDLSQFDIAKDENRVLIYDQAYQRGLLLKKYGINLNFAPVADLNINPDNPAIGKWKRSFGDNPAWVTHDLEIVIRAYKESGILCTLKHFPGLGSANANTDYDYADLTSTWSEKELKPYKELIKQNAACAFVMTSHLVNRKLDESGMPLSLSKKVVTDLLRNKLKFKGLVITDDMDAIAMRQHYSTDEAIRKVVLAGNNVIIYGGTQGNDPYEDAQMLFTTLMNLVGTDADVRHEVYESYKKIEKIKKELKN